MVEQIRCVEGVARLVVVNNVEIGAGTGAINQREKSCNISVFIFYSSRWRWDRLLAFKRRVLSQTRNNGEEYIRVYFSIFRGG